MEKEEKEYRKEEKTLEEANAEGERFLKFTFLKDGSINSHSKNATLEDLLFCFYKIGQLIEKIRSND